MCGPERIVTWWSVPVASRRWLLAAAAGLACGGVAAKHEVLGDRAFAEGRYGDAVVEYRLELVQRGPSGVLHAKAGVAALEARDLAIAVEEFVALGTSRDSLERLLAADGLQRVAEVAREERNDLALSAALQGLVAVAPGRAVGHFALQLVGGLGAAPTDRESLDLLRRAAASAANARVQDSLMLRYARGVRRRGDCVEAIPIFESLVRRSRDRLVGSAAAAEATGCALGLGQGALDDGSPSAAEEWFRLAVAIGGDSPTARAAYIGLGDVQLAQGDYISAAEAYLRAMDGLVPGDSLYDIASNRLGAIADAQRGLP
jgi:tetratricopeptide (TPR) repeat protein